MEPTEEVKPEPTRLWQLIKNLEEKSEGQIQQLNEMIATLLINFSEHNKGRLPVLISDKDTPTAMLMKVLEYYIKPQ